MHTTCINYSIIVISYININNSVNNYKYTIIVILDFMQYFINPNFASEFADALFRTTFLSMLHVLTTYHLAVHFIIVFIII